ncbi:MAG: penicillin-binding protein 1A, partial [Asticcacaulis sp.]
MAGVIVMTSVSVAGLAVAIYAAWLFHDLPDSTRLAEYRPPTATRVYAWDGTLIGEFSRERRIFVPYDRIPPTLVQAFLAAEDRNFFNHGGVDFTGLSRAMAKNVSNLVNGRRLEGGSTITQQVAKNIQLSSEVTVGRKLKEVILARRLESTLDKKQILELYLNEIFLGYRSFGVASAAFNYFGKSLDDLTIAEMAYLASLPKGPANYHPIRFKQSAVERRNWILGEMHKLGWITEAEYQTALKEDLVVQNAPMRARYRDADYFLEEVRRQGTTAFGEKLFSGGYYLRTTLDAQMQTSARDALMRGLELYDYRHGWRGASASGDPKGDWKPQASKLRIPAERTKWVGAIVESSAGGNVRVTTVKDDKGRIRDADVIWANASKPLKKGDIVIVEELTRGVMALRQVPRVNGALVAIDPWSGRVLAMVGGYSFSLSKFNRATQAYRQPGSAFKPFVYAAALEGDFTPASIVVDGPISFKGANGKVWSPKNYSRRYYGPQTLRKGLELSRNAMTVRLAN